MVCAGKLGGALIGYHYAVCPEGLRAQSASFCYTGLETHHLCRQDSLYSQLDVGRAAHGHHLMERRGRVQYAVEMDVMCS